MKCIYLTQRTLCRKEIIESFRLEKMLKIIESNHKPNTKSNSKPTLSHVSRVFVKGLSHACLRM